MPSKLTQAAALDLLETGARILTPSSTAASALRAAFNRRQTKAGRNVWNQPDILSWSQWLSTQWTALTLAGHEDRLLLNSAQELSLWGEIIAADPAATPLTPTASLASLAQSAFSLAAAYRVTHRLRSAATTHDARTFATWADHFRRQCDRQRWLSSALLETALTEHLAAGNTPPSNLHVLGFPELTPAQTALLGALAEAGASILTADLISDPNQQPQHAATILPDPTAELRFAAEYAKTFLAENPDTTVALILPDLAAEATTFEPILREILAPHLNDIAADPAATPWTTTAAPPLASHAAVGPLLDLARWLRSPLPVDRITALLLSPFFDAPATRNDRVRFDAHVLRRQLLLRPELDLRSTLTLARHHEAPSFLIELLQSLAELSDLLATQPPRRTYADWTEWLRTLRKAAAWAAPETHPALQPVMEAFDAVLDLAATLDFVGHRVTLPEALEAIATQARITPTPGENPSAPIQLLSPAEAQGLVFDAAVFLRATDATLPSRPRTNPLLDWQLQRQFAMPGTDPSRDVVRAENAFALFLAAVPNVLLTHALADETGPLRSSTFTSRLISKVFNKNDFLEISTIYTQPRFDVVPDSDRLPSLPSNELSGGARLLQLQAACGFLAFAELRLGGRELDTPEPGFDAMESGNILHRALERFWNQVKTQDALRAMSTADRVEAISRSIDHAISRRLHIRDPWDQAYLAVQKERMRALLLRWLDFELARAPFTVLENESKQPVDIGPLHLSLRIDRIDRLTDGGLVFVDYKTGAAARPAAWAGDRPDEPQLPLYTLLAEPDEVHAMAFAKLRAGEEMQYTGYAIDHEILPKKGAKIVDLPYEIQAWRDTLSTLAQNFQNGITEVSPKSYAVNCKRCSQRLLCRLDLTTLMTAPEEDDV